MYYSKNSWGFYSVNTGISNDSDNQLMIPSVTFQQDIKTELHPIIDHIKEYDRLRLRSIHPK